MAEQKKRGPGRPPGSKNKNTSRSSGSSKQEQIRLMQEDYEAEKRKFDVIWSITLMAFGIFLLVTVVRASTGAFGVMVHDVCLGLFGFMAYVLPFFFMLCSVLLLAKKLQHINGRTSFFIALIFINICIMNSCRFLPDKEAGISFADIAEYYTSGVNGDQGGVIGMEIGALLVNWFGKTGLWIIASAILLISIFLVFNTRISEFFEEQSKKREGKRLLARLNEEEQAKVQMAVAAAATPGADPDTGILPARASRRTFTLFDNFGKDKDSEKENESKSKPEIPSVTVPEKETRHKDEAPLGFDSALSDRLSGDSAADRKGYGLGEGSAINRSGSYGLGGEENTLIRNKTGRIFGLSETSDKPAESKESINRQSSADVTANTSASEHSSATEHTVKPAAVTAKEHNKDNVSSDEDISFSEYKDDSGYKLPPIEGILKKSTGNKQLMSEYQLEEKADLLEKTLQDFNVDASVISVTQGASVTRYEVQPAKGVKVSSITRLTDDIALNLSAKSIRIEAPIPGKPYVGIEVENEKPSPVLVRELIESPEFQKSDSKISFVVGKDISGNDIVANLRDMPHLLIAGATGSGKSVCINTIVASFLYKAKPSELKLIMIDPKVVELANYNGIPHMLTPVVTDARKASRALAIAVEEMNKRYERFAAVGVKDLVSYNEKMKAELEPQNCYPEIVIIIDELADLMMAAPSEVENSICRLAQKARAAGMHLIVATQRPSVDVVTGLIKANIPSRIAFSVSSQFDSRTILDMAGAERLLGKGDMLFSPVGSNKPYRVQGPYISDVEIEKLIKFVKKQGGYPEYNEEIKNAIENNESMGGKEPEDELTEDAITFILKSKQASVSMLQRRFRIGYNRAARIIDEIEARGIIGPSDGSRPRQVLVTEEEYFGSFENDEERFDALTDESPADNGNAKDETADSFVLPEEDA